MHKVQKVHRNYSSKTLWSTFLVQLFERFCCSYVPPHFTKKQCLVGELEEEASLALDVGVGDRSQVSGDMLLVTHDLTLFFFFKFFLRFLVLAQLSAHLERVDVSRMRNFFDGYPSISAESSSCRQLQINSRALFSGRISQNFLWPLRII